MRRVASGQHSMRRTLVECVVVLFFVASAASARSSARERENGEDSGIVGRTGGETVDLGKIPMRMLDCVGVPGTGNLGPGARLSGLSRQPLVWHRTALFTPERTPVFSPGAKVECGGQPARVIAEGFHEAYRRLNEKSCAKLFGGGSQENGVAGTMLQQMLWGVFTDRARPMTVAQTSTKASHAEFNAASTVFDNGDPIWRSPNFDGLRLQYRFGDRKSLTAFFILHELAHHLPERTGFGFDAGPGLERVNESNSLKLIRACFLDSRVVTK